MKNKLKAKLYKVEQTQIKEFGDKKFYTRELILDASRYDEYTGALRPNFIQVIVQGEDRCKSIDTINLGSILECSYYIQGSKYEKNGEEKFFTRIIVFQIDVLKEPTPESVPIETPKRHDGEPVIPISNADGDIDSLPF